MPGVRMWRPDGDDLPNDSDRQGDHIFWVKYVLKVAIVGAGISGLACAISLEKYGIVPDVFEQLIRPGGVTPSVQTILQIVHRAVADPVDDLAKNYGISLTPVNLVKKIDMFSPGNRVTVTGRLGYIFERGHSRHSLDCELYSKLSTTKIQFNAMAAFRKLAAEYDRVVVATGSPFFAMEAGCYSEILRSWARGAVIEGRFDPNTLAIWFNKSYARNGFAYMAPFSPQKASLILEATDLREEEAEPLWRRFLETEKLDYRETESFLREHNVGICCPRQFKNIIFIGMAAGLLDYTLGFGLYNAVISGTLAAESIYDGSSYEDKIQKLLKRSYYTYLIRLSQNGLNNDDYDKILKLLNLPYMSRAIYNTNIDVIKLLANSLKVVGQGDLHDKFNSSV